MHSFGDVSTRVSCLTLFIAMGNGLTSVPIQDLNRICVENNFKGVCNINSYNIPGWGDFRDLRCQYLLCARAPQHANGKHYAASTPKQPLDHSSCGHEKICKGGLCVNDVDGVLKDFAYSHMDEYNCDLAHDGQALADLLKFRNEPRTGRPRPSHGKRR